MTMTMKNRISGENFTNQRGQTIVLVALLLVILIGAVGVALDYGTISMRATKLQHACDAAALAAAGYYGDQMAAGGTEGAVKVAATSLAQTVASKNYEDASGNSSATFNVSASGVYGVSVYKVKVTGSDTVSLLFGAIFKSAQSIGRYATAVHGSPGSYYNPLPIAIPLPTFNSNRGNGNITYKYNNIQHDTFTGNEFIAIDYSQSGTAKSVNDWQSRLNPGSSDNWGKSTVGDTGASLNSDASAIKDTVSDFTSMVGSYVPILLTTNMPQNSGTSNPPILNYVMVKIKSASYVGRSTKELSLVLEIPDQVPSTAASGATGTIGAVSGNITVTALFDDL